MLKFPRHKGGDKHHFGDSVAAKRADSDATLLQVKKNVSKQINAALYKRRVRSKSETFYNSWDYCNDFVHRQELPHTTSGDANDHSSASNVTATPKVFEKIKSEHAHHHTSNVAHIIVIEGPEDSKSSSQHPTAETLPDPRLVKDDVDRQLEDLTGNTSDEEIEAKPKKRKKKTFKAKQASGSESPKMPRVTSPIKKIPAHRSQRKDVMASLNVPASASTQKAARRKSASNSPSKPLAKRNLKASEIASEGDAFTDTEPISLPISLPTSPENNVSRRKKFGKSMRRETARLLLVATSNATESTKDLIYEEQDGIQVLIAGTINQLVSMVTVRIQDYSLLRSFLLCKDHFISGAELLSRLVNIYDKAPEVIQDEQQLDYVRMRVINVVKKWLHFNLNDFKVEELVASLNSFIRKMKATKDPKQRGWAEALQTAFDSTFTYKNTIERKFSLAKIDGAPKPIISKRVKALETQRDMASTAVAISMVIKHILSRDAHKDLHVLDLEPTEVARQWTLIDQQDFRQLGYLELLNKNFEKEATAPHVAAMHKRFNKMVSWVGAEIISGANPKQRAKTVTFFIALARALLEMQNFHGLMAVGSGLAQMPVARLKETWKKLSSSAMNQWKNLEIMITPIGNFRALRPLHDKVNPPLIPTPTIFLKDLLFIEDGNEDWYDFKRGLLSWEKIKLLGKVLARIQLAQELPYTLQKINVIQDYLMNVQGVSQDQLEAMSKQAERGHSEW